MKHKTKILATALLSATAFVLGMSLQAFEPLSTPYPTNKESAAKLAEGMEGVLDLPSPPAAPSGTKEESETAAAQSLAPVGSVEDAAGPADDGWNSLRRNDRSMLSFILRAERDGEVDTSLLFRNGGLNPLDMPIKKSVRGSLSSILRDVIYQIHALGKVERDYHNNFGRALVAVGEVEPLEELPEPTDDQLRMIRRDLSARLKRMKKSAASRRPGDTITLTEKDRADKIANLRKMITDPLQAAGCYYFAPEGTWALRNSEGFYQLQVNRFPEQKQIDDVKMHFRMQFVGLLVNYFETQGTLLPEAKMALLRKYF